MVFQNKLENDIVTASAEEFQKGIAVRLAQKLIIFAVQTSGLTLTWKVIRRSFPKCGNVP